MNHPSFSMGIHEIATAVNGQLKGQDVMVHGVSTDSRSIEKQNLFVALTGPNFDGHNFVTNTIEKGAAAVIVDRQMDIHCPQVIVKDTRIALGKLANAWRKKFTFPLIAVTGSNGKTTVKEMLTAILSVNHPVLATQGNLNNDIGVPLTLFRLGEQHEFAVIEMGANHAGEIAYLTDIARPDIAMITNAGPAHLEGFGSLEGVAKAKGEIYSGLSESGTAIINADDQFNPLWRDYCAAYKTLTFGLEHEADITADWSVDDKGSLINANTPAGEVSIHLPLLGRHNVMNALGAIAGTLAAGISLPEIKAGLESLQPVKGRLQIKSGLNGSRVIDDTYNANPASLNAALDVLGDFTGQHYLALGDMGELGNNAEQLHHAAGQQARKTGVHKLFTIGELAKHAASGFGSQAKCFADQPAMINALSGEMSADVTLLVKGSRLMHMEQVVDALTVNGENH
jgi:UDP-N-acetylmuramoyl-tripeptide--D-alanyl-D-alanine ligase